MIQLDTQMRMVWLSFLTQGAHSSSSPPRCCFRAQASFLGFSSGSSRWDLSSLTVCALSRPSGSGKGLNVLWRCWSSWLSQLAVQRLSVASNRIEGIEFHVDRIHLKMIKLTRFRCRLHWRDRFYRKVTIMSGYLEPMHSRFMVVLGDYEYFLSCQCETSLVKDQFHKTWGMCTYDRHLLLSNVVVGHNICIGSY